MPPVRTTPRLYRLNVFPITLPPLRERREDIPLLARFIVDRFAAQVGKRIESVSPGTLERLVAYAWPGNVRELENVLVRAVILATGTTLELAPELLSAEAVPPPRSEEPGAPLGLKALEREHIVSALERAHWIVEGAQGAARALDLHPNTLRSRPKRLGIARPGGTGTHRAGAASTD